jgi:hypothetical protein
MANYLRYNIEYGSIPKLMQPKLRLALTLKPMSRVTSFRDHDDKGDHYQSSPAMDT